MNSGEPASHAAFVLHQRPYRDTSLLVDLLTEQQGRITVVARGAKAPRSRFRGTLLPFLPLWVQFTGRGELRTLQQAEPAGPGYLLQGAKLLSGLYLNELLMRLLPLHEADIQLYRYYHQILANLPYTLQLESELRLFEKQLLTSLGYGLHLEQTIQGEPIVAEGWYSFKFGHGFAAIPTANSHALPGSSLIALKLGQLTTTQSRQDAKRLLRAALTKLLGNRPLRSRELFFRG